MSEFKSLIGIVRILNCFLFFPNGVIIVNALRKSLVLATSFAALGVYNSAMAEMVYKPVEQPVEAPNPNLKIEAVNEKFAEKYPSQFNSWKATEKGDKIIYANEQDPRLIVLWGGYSFAKEYNAPRGHVYAVEDVRNILRTGAPKNANDGPQPMACWTCKGPDVPRLIAEWGEDGYFGQNGLKAAQKL
mgnify:CR=1 FL=1